MPSIASLKNALLEFCHPYLEDNLHSTPENSPDVRSAEKGNCKLGRLSSAEGVDHPADEGPLSTLTVASHARSRGRSCCKVTTQVSNVFHGS